MDAQKIQCPKCGCEATVCRRHVRYSHLLLPFEGPVRVPEAVTLEIDCPQCGKYSQTLLAEDLLRGTDPWKNADENGRALDRESEEFGGEPLERILLNPVT